MMLYAVPDSRDALSRDVTVLLPLMTWSTQRGNLPEGRSWVPVPYLTVHLGVTTFHLTEASVWNPETHKIPC
jgi:hypothetical protein